MNPRTYFTPQNGYNPRYGARSSRAPVKNSTQYSVDDVWAAACAAQRVNSEYVKEDRYVFNDETGERTLVKRRNRDVMMDFLASPGTIAAEDRTAGQECRRYLQNDLTFRALKGRLTEFDSSVSRVVAVEDEFDSVQHRLELAIVACLPQSHQRGLVRADVDQRLARCRPLDADVNDKVTTNVEVLRSNFSQQYGIFWITAVTKDDRAVFFSSREGYDVGTWLGIRGTVKAQRDGRTQLNRVKVV